MVLEARGLDITPLTIERFRAAGDSATARILERVLADEIRHVGFGSRHFAAVCSRRRVEPENHWRSLVQRHFRGGVSGPFNNSARAAAGLPRTFYEPIAS